jgi:hypothetical protein
LLKSERKIYTEEIDKMLGSISSILSGEDRNTINAVMEVSYNAIKSIYDRTRLANDIRFINKINLISVVCAVVVSVGLWDNHSYYVDVAIGAFSGIITAIFQIAKEVIISNHDIKTTRRRQ